MIAIGIGVFVFIQLIALVFILGMCRSAARADNQFERASMEGRTTRAKIPGNIEGIDVRAVSTDARSPRLPSSPAHAHNR